MSLSEEIGNFINVVYFPIEDKEEFKTNFRGKLPQFRTFRNVLIGKSKIDSSFEILVPQGLNQQ